MSATFSSELQLYQYLDHEDRATGGSDENDALEVQPVAIRSRAPVMLGRTGSTTFRGSFSEIMAAKEEKQQQEHERIMYDALFPSETLVDPKEKKTFFANPLCADASEDEPYVTQDPDDEVSDRRPSPRPFSVRMSSLLGLFKPQNHEEDADLDESLPRRSFSMRLTTPSSSRASSLNGGQHRDKSSSSSQQQLKKYSSSDEKTAKKSMRMSRRLIKRLTGQSADEENEPNSNESSDTPRKSVRMSTRIKKLLFSQQQ